MNIEKQSEAIEKLPVIVGLNLGKNKSTEDIADDYIKGIRKFSDTKCIHYLVINISSPNTPHLRDLQSKKELNELIEKVLKVKNEYNIEKPLLIKIAPDLEESQVKDIANIINKYASNKSKRGIDGLIVSNTTVDRPPALQSEDNLIKEKGGLSGVPLKQRSTDMIRKIYKLTNGKIPIIGVGGVFNGEDAYDKIKAGASLVQIYTAIAYEVHKSVNKN
jgi:dihydroorotate dehydrogenase